MTGMARHLTARRSTARTLAASVAICAALAGLRPTALEAGAVEFERAVNDGAEVTLYLHPFLTPEELATLRLVATNGQALALFVKSREGYAAMAASPDEGVVRNGTPVASAVALADLPDAAAARSAALAACDGLRKGKAACVVVLDVAPAP